MTPVPQNIGRRAHDAPRALRAALLATAAVGLVVGVWSGLARSGVIIPVGDVVDPATHGIVMVSGFFGALISLERAVALDRPWAYAAPPAAAFGALGLAAGVPGAALASLVAAIIMTTGSVLLWRVRPTVFMATMTVGAAAWVIAAALEIGSVAIERQVPWLATFLVATIVGERLELSRLAPPSRWKTPVFLLAMALLAIGCIAAALGSHGAWNLFGAGLVVSGLWLALFDVARRTIRMRGVTGFIAACLLSGYVWLGVSGMWFVTGGNLFGTLAWDGALHALFVGFVFSMVFGHVHMVAPAVLGISVPYRRWFGIHLIALHLSLALRVIGDLAADADLRRWGAIGNALAIGLFLAATAASVLMSRKKQRRHSGPPTRQHHERPDVPALG